MVLLIAHRGCSSNRHLLFPLQENTVSVIFKAATLGYMAVEVDVQLTRDGVPVMWHNDKFQRKPIHSYTYSSIKQYNIDTLVAALLRFPYLCFNIELKIPKCYKRNATYKYDLVSATISAIKKANHRLIVLSSFDLDTCIIAQALAPQKVYLITKSPKPLRTSLKVAKRNNLDGVVFDCKTTPVENKCIEYPHRLDIWCYNGTHPLATACILDYRTSHA